MTCPYWEFDIEFDREYLLNMTERLSQERHARKRLYKGLGTTAWNLPLSFLDDPYLTKLFKDHYPLFSPQLRILNFAPEVHGGIHVDSIAERAAINFPVLNCCEENETVWYEMSEHLKEYKVADAVTGISVSYFKMEQPVEPTYRFSLKDRAALIDITKPHRVINGTKTERRVVSYLINKDLSFEQARALLESRR